MDIEQQNGAAEEPSTAAAAGLSAKGLARRRFGKAGAGASGVLLTLVSQPGMACEICKAPSGSLSGGLKSHTGPAPACVGELPSYWIGQPRLPGGLSASTSFNLLFHCTTYATKSNYGKANLGGMLSGQTFDSKYSYVGKYLCATYLNVLSGKIGFLTTLQVQNIWKELQLQGVYKPTAEISWDAQRIVTYLKGTMG